MKRFFNWLSRRKAPEKSTTPSAPLPRVRTRPIAPLETEEARPEPEYVEFESPDAEDADKPDVDEGGGIDPYNTGNFDRSKNWDKRSRND